MKPVETSTSDFADLRKKGCIYVDKTTHFYRLVSDPEPTSVSWRVRAGSGSRS